MARTHKPPYREVIEIDDGPDTSGPVKPYRPTPEIKSEADSDASSSTRVFARTRAPPVIKDASLRKQIEALKRKIYQTHVATDAADTQEQGRQALMDMAAQLGLSHMIQPATGTTPGPQGQRGVSAGGSSPIGEDDIDEEELGRRDEYRRRREEILAPDRSVTELDEASALEYKELGRVEKMRRQRRAADLARMLEDDLSDAEREENDDGLFVGDAEFDLAEHLDADQVAVYAESESDTEDDEYAAGPSTQQGQTKRILKKKQKEGRRAVMRPLKAQPEHQFHSLTTFDPRNMQPNYDLARQPAFAEATITGTDEALRILRARTFANHPNLTAEEQKSIRDDIASLKEAISWFCGAGRSVKPAPSQAGWKITGLRPGTILKHYQVFGTGWMREREQGSWQPRGGILADSMGLGKTIMTLAAIADDRPPRDQRVKGGPSLTLIVGSRALMDQWYDEIALHCDARIVGDVYRYYGSGKKGIPKNKLNAFRKYRIVLTTWYEVRESWPFGVPPKQQAASPEEDRAWRLNVLTNQCGLLHRIHWKRIVCDEIDMCKNKMSQVSVAASKIKADIRWALSGTLLSNSVSEVYSYLRFLHYPNLPTYREWSKQYLVPKAWQKDQNLSDEEREARRQIRNEKNEALGKVLGKLMLRRVNDYKFLGAPVLSLPATQIKHQFVDFSTFEFEVYKIVEHRMQTIVQRMIKADRLRRSYAQVFKMLLILRQLTAHPLLIEKAMREVLLMEDIQQLIELADNELGQAKDEERQSNMVRMRTMLHEEQMRFLQEHDSLEAPEPLTDPVGTGESYGDTFDFRPVIKDLTTGPNNSWKQYRDEMVCNYCRYKPFAPRITDCQHIYCTECLHEMQLEAAYNDEDRARCKQCKVAFEVTHPLKNDIYGSEVEDIPEPDEDELRAANKKGRNRAKERARAESWIGRDHGCIVPSAKTIAVKAQLLNWISECPDIKILVYCQFLDVIRIIGKMCNIEGWEYVVYHGELSHERRKGSLDEFRNNPNCRIMIATLKTGGVGLNLTVARRVILVDLWWNLAVENQAWGRVHRIGQVSETRMSTFVVRNTIDEDMREMQDYKKDSIDAIMEGKNALLNPKQICRLFGFGRSAAMPEDLDSSDVELDEGEDDGDYDAEY